MSVAPQLPYLADVSGRGVDVASNRVPWISLGAIVLLAAVLRGIGLGSELWLDEMYTMKLALRAPFVELLTVYKGDNQHPLFSLLGHLSITLFGDTPWAARLPATLFGVASVPLLYLLDARVASRRESLLAAALLAVSYHHVWFSQNARGYTMLAFWTLAMTILLLRGIQERRASLFTAYGVVAGLAVYTHLTAVFLVAAHALIGAWLVCVPSARDRLDWRLPLLGFTVAGLVTLVLHGPIVGQVLQWFLYRPSQLVGVSTPAWALAEAIRGLRVGLGTGFAVLAGGAVFLVGFASYARRSRLVAALFVLPVLTMLMGALVGRGTMYPRFFFFLIGIALLIAVRGAFVVGAGVAAWLPRTFQTSRLNEAAGTLLVMLMIGASLWSLRINYAYPKQSFLAAAAYVEEHASSGEPIAVISTTGDAYIDYYAKPWTRLTTADDLMALRAGGRRVWLLYTFPRYVGNEAAGVLETIHAECADAERFYSTIGDGDVFACILPARVRNTGG